MRNVFRALPLVLPVLLVACSAATQTPSAASGAAKRVVLVAGRPSHPPGAHEHNAGVALFKRCLDEIPGIEAVARFNGWPADSATVFEGADAVLIYADGGNGHPAIQGNRLQLMERLASRGTGMVMIHYANEVPADRGGQEFQRWTGGYYETNFSVNPIWTPQYQRLPNHPVTRGVQPFSTRDEWYFNMRFRPGMSGITPILQAVPSDSVRDGPYVSPRGPYPHIQAAKGEIATMSWAVERPDGGRGFGFTGGHFHENWGNPNQRKLVLNAILWAAKAEVPAGGVNCAVTAEDLTKNLDPKGQPR
jgi:type 1 glutamine amidotransferase